MDGSDMLGTTLCPHSHSPSPPASSRWYMFLTPVPPSSWQTGYSKLLLSDSLPNLISCLSEPKYSPFRLPISFYRVNNSVNTICAWDVTSSGSHSPKHEVVSKQTRVLIPIRTQSQAGNWSPSTLAADLSRLPWEDSLCHIELILH